jgi:thioredoxin 1
VTVAKRTQQVIDIRGHTEMSTLPDGTIRLYFEPMDIEATGSTEEDARDMFRRLFEQKMELDDVAREAFEKWAPEHVVEMEMTDEEIREEEEMENLAKEAGKGFPELVPDTFDAAIAVSKPVLIDFWAPWCKPCLFAAPVLKEIHDELADVFDVAKVNVEDHPQLGERFDVQGIPCFVLFREGEEVDRLVGSAPKEQFRAAIDELLAKL